MRGRDHSKVLLQVYWRADSGRTWSLSTSDYHRSLCSSFAWNHIHTSRSNSSSLRPRKRGRRSRCYHATGGRPSSYSLSAMNKFLRSFSRCESATPAQHRSRSREWRSSH